MKKSVLFVLLVCAFTTISAQSPLPVFVDSIAHHYLKKYPHTSLVIGVQLNGEETLFSYAGSACSKEENPDSNSIYEIGNITETFTSILYADLFIKGILNMDDPLQKYLPVDVPSPVYQAVICKPSDIIPPREPDTYENKDEAFMKIKFTPYTCVPDPSSVPQPVLLCYLATHTSGFPEYPSNLKLKKNRENPFSEYSKDELYEFLRSYRPGLPVGFDYMHSDLGIALLGHVLSLRTNTTYDSLLIKNLLMPMGLSDTRIELSSAQQERFLKGYTAKGDHALHRSYAIFAPSAALRSSLKDMMHFLDCNIKMKKDTLTDLLDYTHNPRIRIAGENSRIDEIALGWLISSLDHEKRMVWQSGLTGGFASFIGFVETSHTGVVILSNTAAPVSDLGKAILQKIN